MIPQNVYDAANAAYALSVEQGDTQCVRNAVDAAIPLIRDYDLEEFLEGSGIRRDGLESRIRWDQVKRIRRVIHNLPKDTASEGIGPWNEGYQAAIDDILDLLEH